MSNHYILVFFLTNVIMYLFEKLQHYVVKNRRTVVLVLS